MIANAHVPFLDLVTPHEELEQELVTVFRSALHTAGFIGGPMLEGFEQDFARFFKTQFCAGVSTGTDALRFALMAAGVQPGSIVLTVPLTFIATTVAISQAGGLSDFLENDSGDCNLDPANLRRDAGSRCRYDLVIEQ